MLTFSFTKKPPKIEPSLADYKAVLATREIAYGKRIDELLREIELLKLERMGDDYSKRKALRLMDVSIGDPTPDDPLKRAEYVREVGNFYSDFFEKKLLQLISFVREELDWSGLVDDQHKLNHLNGITREQYDFLMRGTSNALKLLISWGEEMRNENSANQEAERQRLADLENGKN